MMRYYLVFENGQPKAQDPIKVLASDESDAMMRVGFTHEDATVVPCCDGSDPLCSDCSRELANQVMEEGYA